MSQEEKDRQRRREVARRMLSDEPLGSTRALGPDPYAATPGRHGIAGPRGQPLPPLWPPEDRD